MEIRWFQEEIIGRLRALILGRFENRNPRSQTWATEYRHEINCRMHPVSGEDNARV